jgi:hypothetical protein
MNKLFLGFALCLGMALNAQDLGAVRGTITDAETYGEPLLMAHVALKETQANTLTNFHGNFEFEGLEPGDYTLHISFLGYEELTTPITIKGGERLEINEVLKALRMDTAPRMTSHTDTQEQATALSSMRR